jgi:hypothetical protein
VVLLSFVLVIVAAVTLVIGLLTSGLALVFVSIACSAVAGVVLIAAVLRSRPRTVAATGGPAPLTQPAPEPGSWATTSSTATFADEDEEAEAPAAAAFGGAGSELPIADFDNLKVGEIVPLLSELDIDELEAIRDYEQAGKARNTILSRIEVLIAEAPEDDVWTASEFGTDVDMPMTASSDEFPIADYDELRIGEITPLLPELEPDELEVVRAHEAGGRARAGILTKIDSLLGVGAPAAPAKRAPAKKAATAAKKATAGTAKKAAVKKPAPAKSTVKKAAAKKTTAAKKATKKAR